MKKFWKYLLSGFRYKFYYRKCYLVNKNTGEIHKMNQIKDRCTRYMAEHNKLYMSEYDLKVYMKSHPMANGCVHCNTEMDTDVRKVHINDECVYANEYFNIGRI